MSKVPLAIVGCGGMGGRHLRGLKELHDAGLCDVELVAVCDLNRENAERLADDAAQLLGKRPLAFQDLGRMAAQVPDLQAVAITTDCGSHHTVAVTAFERGWHVFCEKPLALTMRGANLILQAHQRSGKVLSVAENYRRDPLSRLTKALLDAHVIGSPYLLLDVSASAGNEVVILPWRHDKLAGGILLDGGVHNADMMQYYLGRARDVSARIAIWEPVRHKRSTPTNVSPFYQPWQHSIPARIQATAEDTLVSVLTFEGGAMGQWTAFYAAHGRGTELKAIFGSEGSLRPAGIRNGVSPVVHLDDGNEVQGAALLDLVPSFRLDPITAQLFGADRLASYNVSFPEADRKLLAIEYHEFGECCLGESVPEVDGTVGRSDMALCYAAFESSKLGRAVSLDEIESGETGVYESDINAHYRI